MQLGELRLVVERLEVRRPARHVEEDDAFGLGGGDACSRASPGWSAASSCEGRRRASRGPVRRGPSDVRPRNARRFIAAACSICSWSDAWLVPAVSVPRDRFVQVEDRAGRRWSRRRVPPRRVRSSAATGRRRAASRRRFGRPRSCAAVREQALSSSFCSASAGRHERPPVGRPRRCGWRRPLTRARVSDALGERAGAST